FSSRRRHTRSYGDWSSDVCSSDLSNRSRNEIIIAENAIGRVDSDPAGPRQKNFRPRMQRAFGATNFLIRFTQISGDDSRCQTERSEERRVGKEWRSRWTTMK